MQWSSKMQPLVGVTSAAAPPITSPSEQSTTRVFRMLAVYPPVREGVNDLA
jgi:hypothetical protein